MNRTPEPLAIVGIGCLFPKAVGPAAFWSNLLDRVDGVTDVPPTHWSPDDYFHPDPKKPDHTYARRGAFLDPYPFVPGEFGIAPNDLEATDTAQLLGLVAAKMALADAEKFGPKIDRNRTSTLIGVTGTLELVVPLGARLGHPLWRKALKAEGVADEVADRVVGRISEGYVGWQENSFPGLLGNVVAGRIANRLDLGGTNCVVDAACASSLSAVHLAAMELHAGRADAVITGGVDTFNDIFMYMCFSKTPALSPTGDARPFDAAGDGTILGEGLGMLVLMRHSDAEAAGRRIYALIRGVGTSSDGKGQAIYAPSSAGQVRCLEDAYRAAGVSPDTIELVEAHGTGTKAGDAAEVAALIEVYRRARPTGSWCALGSVKSQIGHTKAAAGAAGLIKAALALYHKVQPPTLKVTAPAGPLEPGRSPFFVNTLARPWLRRDAHPRRAAVSSFGFGGSNFHCVLEESADPAPAAAWSDDVQILAFSADTPDELDRLSHPVADSVGDELRFAAAESRRSFDPTKPYRRTIVRVRGESTVYDGSGPAARLGFLFPGQGSQTVGMLRDLACRFAVFRDVLAEADRAFAAGWADPGDERLSDLIYPPPAFTRDQAAAQDAALRATAVAQPALGAVSLGAAQVLRQFGVTPDAAAGHSYGELTALCAAGCFDAPSLFALSQLRGRLMAERRGGDDPGAMLAVLAPMEEVERAIAEESFDLVIANRNAPAQAVLSGRTAEIERASRSLARRKLRHVRLPVAAAFHSSLVAEAEVPFRAALEPIDFRSARLPVFANVTAAEYPRDPQSARDLLAAQLAKPVDFVRQIRNMVDSGVRVFLEVGPGSTLTRLTDQILDGVPHVAIALDASGGQRPGLVDLAHALARLAALGHPVRLSEWGRPPEPRPAKPALTVPICGANYVRPKPPSETTVAATPAPVRRTDPRPAPPPVHVVPMNPDPSPGTAPALSRVLQATQDSLAAFLRLQEQTAELQRQFLGCQEAAQRTLQTLVEGQQRLLAAALGTAVPELPPAPPRPVDPQPLSTPAPRPWTAPAPVMPPAPPTPPTPPTARPWTADVSAVPPAPPPPPSPSPLADTGPLLKSRSQPAQAASLADVLLAVVAEKTGYPVEALELHMDLNADLGIDSIKRVEILSAVQDRLPDLPPIQPEQLGSLQTLAQVVALLEPAANPTPPPEPRTAPPATSNGFSKTIRQLDDPTEVLLAVVAEKTGYPVEALEPHMDLNADLGIDSIKRVEILSAVQDRLPDLPAVEPEQLGSLQTLAQIVELLGAKKKVRSPDDGPPLMPTLAALDLGAVAVADDPALRETTDYPPGGTDPEIAGVTSNLSREVLRAVPLNEPIQDWVFDRSGEVWVVVQPGQAGESLRRALQDRGAIVQCFPWVRQLPSVPDRLAGLLLFAADHTEDLNLRAFRWLQRCGPALKRHGHAFVASLTQLDGRFGLADRIEDPWTAGLHGLIKTAGREWAEVRARAIDVDPALVPGAFAARVAAELLADGPVEVGLTAEGRFQLDLLEAPLRDLKPFPIGPTDAIVVSGGARGVTAEVAVELARAGRPSVLLLGRSRLPGPESPGMSKMVAESDIKRALLAIAGRKLTPREIEDQYQRVMADREIRATIRRIEEAGARVVYRQADVRKPAEIREAVDEFRAFHGGPITGIVHGAGVISDQVIESKTDEMFCNVFETKVEGARALLGAVETDPLRFVGLFSSISGRVGRRGQCDYAAANEVLNKMARQIARRRPDVRVVAVNWGPWEGGMVTPGLQRLFAGEGIGLIPFAEGAKHFLAELADDRREVESVVMFDTPAGDAPASPPPIVTPPPPTEMSELFRRELDRDNCPVLQDHVLNGRSVMPLAVMLEWLAAAAAHTQSKLTFLGFDQVRVLRRLEIGDGEVRPVWAGTERPTPIGETEVAVPAKLFAGSQNGLEFIACEARVILGTHLPMPPAKPMRPHLPLSYPSTPDMFYPGVLFHGPALKGLTAVARYGPAGINAEAACAPPPIAWFQRPLCHHWFTDPLAIDSAFQLMILWCHRQRGMRSLPVALENYRQYVRQFPADGVRIVAEVIRAEGPVVRADIELFSRHDQPLARLEGYECRMSPELDAEFRTPAPRVKQ